MRRLAIIVLATAAGVGLLAPPAGAASPSTGVARPADAASDALAPVDVVQVSGLIDDIPTVAELMQRLLRELEETKNRLNP